MRKWRKMTWVLLIWCALIFAWMIVGAGEANCDDEATEELRTACEAGAGVGILLIALVGFFGFTFLAIIWFMTRPRTKECPRCGEDVKKGRMTCKACGYDFRGTAATT